ncbi:TonB-dependent receptor [Sphingobium sp.]|jgi:iron complex outermembrane receptor protein|uniref:TonB-dependent receptor n=1 Tax=Sphingobium sp. TaxID=1912891 RepID=UPI00257E10CD|nr:TonB-dependent receptor [Sphingobium sp.]MBR2270088.1 TonB-dependent receptor [Sphingobium sp.]
MTRRFRTLLFCACATLPTLPIEAQAQDKAQDRASVTQDIIVTARRTEERLQDVPISITVFNQEELANRNVVNAQDLAAYTPSLSANGNFGSENSSFAIRGFAQDIGTAPSVGVYFADVVAPRGASNGLPSGDGAGPGAFFDLQNVQILKGPQGTLFGRNTTGGAILLVPQKPTDEFSGYVEGSVGNYDMWRGQAVVNAPLGDRARMRIGVDRQKRDGYMRNGSGIGPDRFGDVDYIALRASLVVDLTPDLENYTILSYSDSSNNGPIQKLVAAAPEGLGQLAYGQLLRQGSGFYDVMQSLEDPYSRTEQWQLINTTSWQVSDTLTVKNIVSYAQLKQRMNAPLFGTDFVVDFAAINPFLAALGSYHLPFTTVTSIPGGYTANQSTFTEELQLQGRSGDGRLNWQVGGYLEVSEPLGMSGSQSPFLASCTDSATLQCTDPMGFLSNLDPTIPAFAKPIHAGTVNYTAGRTNFHNVGLYAQATYALTDQLKLTGGFRYTWDHSRNVSDQRTYIVAYPPQYGAFNPAAPYRCTNPQAAATNCVSHYYQSSEKPTWLIDLDYNPTQDILLYAKYARGYRAGTIVPNITAPLNIVEPEKVDSYELGLKTSFGGALRGTFNLAGFYNDFSNQQLQVGFNARPLSGQASTAAPVNAGKSEIWGLEADASLTPFQGLVLTGGYSYLRTKIKSVPDFSSFNDPNYILAAPFQPGDPEVLSPRHKFTVSGTYTLPLDEEKIGRISFGATFTHRSSMLVNYTDRTNPDPSIAALSTLAPLDLLNLNASWNNIAGAPIDLSLFMTNVTREKYYSFIAGLGSPSVNFETATLGEPQMYGARLRFRFGG